MLNYKRKVATVCLQNMATYLIMEISKGFMFIKVRLSMTIYLFKTSTSFLEALNNHCKVIFDNERSNSMKIRVDSSDRHNSAMKIQKQKQAENLLRTATEHNLTKLQVKLHVLLYFLAKKSSVLELKVLKV
ncbi:CLUMA_CG021447, isoform A [Clunio marinus]|uniref:CLUMA_CG021447, isoform A n=1 Tax=Clunio marinus TaxID=568069 RepID=A0A1J1J8U7_9DIPT|nr:CLUMA_CG021447, isoform A [Clunio marinus]